MTGFKINDVMIEVLSEQVPITKNLCRYPTKCLILGSTIEDVCKRIHTGIACLALHTHPHTCQIVKTQIPGCELLGTPIPETPVPCDGSDLPEPTIMTDTEILIINGKKLALTSKKEFELVRAQLNELMDCLAQSNAELSKEMAPQTLEQAEMLEEKLQGALKTVQDIKANLG